MIVESGSNVCCCPVCGRMISYLEYHRNDTYSDYKGYCYLCEDNERKEKEYDGK